MRARQDESGTGPQAHHEADHGSFHPRLGRNFQKLGLSLFLVAGLTSFVPRRLPRACKKKALVPPTCQLDFPALGVVRVDGVSPYNLNR